MDSKPDTIKVTTSVREEIQATHADLMIAIKGSSLVSGDEAFKKAREVSQLVEALTRFGVKQDAIFLQSIQTESAKGPILRTSSATYRLRIRCEKLDTLADLLDIITSQKNTTLEQILWRYAEDAAREAALEKAITSANQKARKIAAALGVRLLGVHTLTESASDQETFPYPQAKSFRAVQSAPAEQPALDMDIRHTKTIDVRVDIEFRVSTFIEQ